MLLRAAVRSKPGGGEPLEQSPNTLQAAPSSWAGEELTGLAWGTSLGRGAPGCVGGCAGETAGPPGPGAKGTF